VVPPGAAEGGEATGGGEGERQPASSGDEAASGDREYVSFEDSFEDELRREFGDLGPAGVGAGGPANDRGDRGDRRGGSGGDRRPRRPRRR
jgi:hypothetical protein